MAININLESICKKAEVFRCIRHKKAPLLKIESDVIIITTCCDNFQEHIENFVERQIELASNQESQKQI